MEIFGILILITFVVAVWCHMVSKKIKKAKEDSNSNKRIIIPKSSRYILAVIGSWICCIAGIFFIALGESYGEGILIYKVFFWMFMGGASVLWIICALLWPRDVILYDDTSFLLGWFNMGRNQFQYNDVTDILKYDYIYEICIGKRKINSTNYHKDLLDFKIMIMEKHERKHTPCEDEITYNPSKKIFKYAYVMFMIMVLIFFCTIPLIVFARNALLQIELDLSKWIWIVPGCICFFVYTWAELMIYCRKCEIRDTGIAIKYPLKRWKIITWDQLQQVCICYEPYKKRYIPPQFKNHSIICFVKSGEKKNSWGYWKINSTFHFHNLICMDYTDELFNELNEVYPNEVVDLRKIKKFNGIVKSEFMHTE